MFSVNNGDDITAEVWIGDRTNGCALTNSNSNASLYVFLRDNSSNQTTSGFWTGNFATTWPTEFNRAEAIQEWNNGGSQDYAQFNGFNFEQGWDATSSLAERNMGISDSTFMTQIGSSSHSEGGSCVATGTVCSDSGTAVRVWWNSHQ